MNRQIIYWLAAVLMFSCSERNGSSELLGKMLEVMDLNDSLIKQSNELDNESINQLINNFNTLKVLPNIYGSVEQNILLKSEIDRALLELERIKLVSGVADRYERVVGLCRSCHARFESQ